MNIVLAALLSGVIGPIILYFLKLKYDNIKKPKDVLNETIENSALITNKLEEIQEIFECDRIWLAQFHNGGNFYPTGKSIQKFSIFYESVAPLATSVQQNFQNIPINLFGKAMNELLENDIVAIPNIKDPIVTKLGLNSISLDLGCKSLYFFAIKNIDHKFIGFIGLSFSRKTKLSDEELYSILNEASLLSGILMNYLKK